MNRREFKNLVRRIIREMVGNGGSEEGGVVDISKIEGVIDNLVNGMYKYSRDEIGGAWVGLVSNLGILVGEVKDFNGKYITAMKKLGIGEKFPELSYIKRLEEVISILDELHMGMEEMAKVQHFDNV